MPMLVYERMTEWMNEEEICRNKMKNEEAIEWRWKGD